MVRALWVYISTILWSPRHWIWVKWNGNRCCWTIFTQKNIKGSLGQWYSYSSIWEKNIVEVLHIYGSISVLLLFCDHQDTKSESCEIEMSISQPIFTHKNIKGFSGTLVSILYKNVENIVVSIHIYGARAISYYFVFPKTLNLSHEKWKLVYLDQCKHIKMKGSMVQQYP